MRLWVVPWQLVFPWKLVMISNYVFCVNYSTQTAGMFVRESASLLQNVSTTQLNYGVAVCDVDNDGYMEWIIAGFKGPNLVLKYDYTARVYSNIALNGTVYENLRDEAGAAIGVCACDVDGDGLEEIYFLNTNDQYWGRKYYSDRLFKFRNGRYEDLLRDPINKNVSHMFAGRSVACVDRKGNGKYGILLASYARLGTGAFGLIEMDETHPENDVSAGVIVLKNVANDVGVATSTGGQGIAVAPIIGTDGYSDIFFVNEGNPAVGNPGLNSLFRNRGDGTFEDIADESGVGDSLENGRGVALTDFNNDGMVDIVYGNWVGPHRLYLQRARERPHFENVASREFAIPSPVRTIIAADFDNDGNQEVFFNNIVYRPYWNTDLDLPTNNKLFKIIAKDHDVDIQRLAIGDASEPSGYGTGAAVADIDGDGRLELLISHGESSPQPLDIYHVTLGHDNNWMRIMPLTEAGAPARGAKVTLTLADDTRLMRIVDGGSGYLCQMEPVAHFGLGESFVKELEVQWPDGHEVTMSMRISSVNSFYIVGYYGRIDRVPRHVVTEESEDSADVTGGGMSVHGRLTGDSGHTVVLVFRLFISMLVASIRFS